MSDPRHMKRAITLARRGEGKVEPNPMVGCVLVRDGKVLGEGWHRVFGGPHAEIEALRAAAKAGPDVRGCDAYVSLEPCCHHGKTPPCTEALIDAGVARVLVGVADPFAQVAGRGIAALRDAGVQVEVGIEHEAASDLIAPFARRVTAGRPWVIAKWAQPLDGRIATATGQSRWISNDASRRQVHQLRARVDAVMVGVGTVIADDPQLTARDVRRLRVARRVVVDPSLRIPLDATLLRSLDAGHGGGPVMIATAQDAIDAHAATVSRLQARCCRCAGGRRRACLISSRCWRICRAVTMRRTCWSRAVRNC